MYRLIGVYKDETEYVKEFPYKGECFKEGFRICFNGFKELKAYKDNEPVYEFETVIDYKNEIDFRLKQKEIDKENRFLREYN